MNGLKLSNSWAGHLVLLNPPYTAATQWRFVNRAIDEVENDQVLRLSPPVVQPQFALNKVAHDCMHVSRYILL